jgi:hypothetical protein
MSRDTSPEAEHVQAAVLRRLAPSRRLEIAIAMSEEVRSLVKQRLHQQHPELDEGALDHALIEELYGIHVRRG